MRMCSAYLHSAAGAHWNIISRKGHQISEEFQRSMLYPLGEDKGVNGQFAANVTTAERLGDVQLFRIIGLLPPSPSPKRGYFVS